MLITETRSRLLIHTANTVKPSENIEGSRDDIRLLSCLGVINQVATKGNCHICVALQCESYLPRLREVVPGGRTFNLYNPSIHPALVLTTNASYPRRHPSSILGASLSPMQ